MAVVGVAGDDDDAGAADVDDGDGDDDHRLHHQIKYAADDARSAPNNCAPLLLAVGCCC